MFHCSENRIGANGIKEIKDHPFFDTDDWDWSNIRNGKLHKGYEIYPMP